MAPFRVDTSFFPRHFEVQTRCLMTVLRDQSGNDVALAGEPGETPGLEEYTFLRLTSSSFSDSLTRLMPFGSPGCSLACDGVASESAGYYSLSFDSALAGASAEVGCRYAPLEPELVPSWSTTTSVDTAGWTHVVIQGGRYVLLDVFKGHLMAMVNASINDVLEAGHRDRLRLYRLGGGTSDGDVFEHPGFMEVNNISISCPNNNEVTI